MTWLYWNLSNSINPKAVDNLEARYCFRRLLISINWKDFGYLTIFLWFSLSKISLARVLERSLLSIKGKHKSDFWRLAIKISVRKPRYVYNRTFTKCLELSFLIKIFLRNVHFNKFLNINWTNVNDLCKICYSIVPLRFLTL